MKGPRSELVTSSSYLLGEPLGEYHKIETVKTLNIYISAYQANFVILT